MLVSKIVMQLFKFNNTNRKPELTQQILSLHIPKTAGTSFAEILKKVYGETAVQSLHIQPLKEQGDWRVIQKGEIITPDQIRGEEPVVHGHFHYQVLQKYAPELTERPIITWLRHPVERVASAYRYADKIYRTELSETHPRLNILNSLKRNLMEYSSIPFNQNLMSKMLSGTALEELFFVGIVEHFEEDLAYLSAKLGWKGYPVVHSNRTKRAPLKPFQEDAIARWNAKDMELYKRAVELRKQRPAL